MNKQLCLFANLLLFITIFIYWTLNSSSVASENLRFMGVIGYTQVLFSLWSWKKIHGSVINPYCVFLLTAYIFLFGQSFLYVFDSVSPKRDLLNMFSNVEIFNSQTVTLLFLNSFHSGALMSIVKAKQRIVNKDTGKQLAALKNVGWFLVAISIAPFMFEVVSKFNAVSLLGYGGLYTGENIKIGIDNVWTILSDYLLPALICLFIVYSNKSKLIQYILYSVFALYILFTMYIGGRTGGVVLILTLGLVYNYYVKKISSRHLILITIVGYVFISFLSVIAMLRNDSDKSISNYIEKFSSSESLFAESISEMGWSMYPLASTMQIVPEKYPYKYGASYLYSLSSIVPNLGFWDLHPAMKNGNLGDWLQKENGLSFGPGYSIVAEAYINFGIYGVIFMFFFGYFLAKFFKEVNSKNAKYNPIYVVLAIIFCFLIIKITRNSFLSLVRSLFYTILPIYIYVKYYVKKT